MNWPTGGHHHYPAPRGAAGRTLLVMLPGAHDVPESFERNGILAALAKLPEPPDALALGLHMDEYVDGSFLNRLEAEVIEPARARGYVRLWVLGVSLGAMAGLLIVKAHPELLEGLILMAPYLGARGLMERIGRAGGLARWQEAGPFASDDERALLQWLACDWGPRQGLECGTRTFLGYGASDRFAAGARLLEAHLPATRVVRIEGAHDWTTWTKLWSGILARDPFSGS